MPSRAKKPRNRPGRPAAGQALTPNEVAEAAFKLIAAEGIAAFSMRRLGQMLGVEAMALYNHFADKEAILDAVASLTLARIPIPAEKGSWKQRIKSLAIGIRQVALQHPHLLRPALTRPSPPSAGLPLVEAALSAFADAGLNSQAQSVAYHTLFLYVRGFCLWEIEEFHLRGNREPAGTAAVLGNYPRTAGTMKLIFNPELDQLFEAGVDIILRGLPGRSIRTK